MDYLLSLIGPFWQGVVAATGALLTVTTLCTALEGLLDHLDSLFLEAYQRAIQTPSPVDDKVLQAARDFIRWSRPTLGMVHGVASALLMVLQALPGLRRGR